MVGDSATGLTLIQSLQRGLRLVEVVTEQGPMTAKDLSGSIGLVLPTTYHLLRTLVHEGYMCRVGDGRYALGPQLCSVARLESRARSLRLVREEMRTLAACAGASVSIGVFQQGEIVVAHFTANARAPRFDCWPGLRLPGHATAIGQNVLQQMSTLDRDEYLATHPLEPLTSHSPTTQWRLEEQLTDDPVTRSDEQYVYGLSCVAASVNTAATLAAVGAGFSATCASRARGRTEDLVAQAAIRISIALRVDHDDLPSPPPVGEPARRNRRVEPGALGAQSPVASSRALARG